MFDKNKVKRFREDFQLAVAQLEKDHGVNISLGTIRFESNELRGKMTARKGNLQTKPIKGDFRVGDIVSINHRKIDSKRQFKVIRINAKNIKVSELEGFGLMSVSPSLLNKQL